MDIMSYISSIAPWHIWLIVALVLMILELFTSGFGIACFGVGALMATIVAATGLSVYWQLIAFTVCSLLTFIYLRPIMLRFLDSKDAQRTNLDSIVGRTARVVEPVGKQQGRVMLDGVDWSAVAEDAEACFAVNDVVTICARKGNILIVK